MSNKEFYEQIISGIITDEAIAHARKELDKIDKRNANRRDKTTAATTGRIDEIRSKLLPILGNETMTIAQITKIYNKNLTTPVTSAQISAWMRQLENSNYVSSINVKVPNAGARKAYCAN